MRSRAAASARTWLASAIVRGMNRMKTFLLTTRLALLGIAASAASLFIAWSGLSSPGTWASATSSTAMPRRRPGRSSSRRRWARRAAVARARCPCSCSSSPRSRGSRAHRLERHAHGAIHAHFANEDAARLRRLPGSREPGPRRRRRARGAGWRKGSRRSSPRSRPRAPPRDSRGPGIFSRYPLELLQQRSGADAPDAWPAIIVRVHAPRRSGDRRAHAPAAAASRARRGARRADRRLRSTGSPRSRAGDRRWAT